MRRHLNYANVVATLALLFAMSGGALAAKHYLLTSTKQIKPSVLKQLKGRAGTRGASGPAGPTGPLGPAGPSGTTQSAPVELGSGLVMSEPVVGVNVLSEKADTLLLKLSNTSATETLGVYGTAAIEGEQLKAWETEIPPGASANSPAFAAQTHFLDVEVMREGPTPSTSPAVHLTCGIAAGGSFNVTCLAAR